MKDNNRKEDDLRRAAESLGYLTEEVEDIVREAMAVGCSVRQAAESLKGRGLLLVE